MNRPSRSRELRWEIGPTAIGSTFLQRPIIHAVSNQNPVLVQVSFRVEKLLAGHDHQVSPARKEALLTVEPCPRAFGEPGIAQVIIHDLIEDELFAEGARQVVTF